MRCQGAVLISASTRVDPAVDLRPALRAVDKDSSTSCRYHPGFYTRTTLYCFVTEAQCERLAQGRLPVTNNTAAGSRTRNHLVVNQTPKTTRLSSHHKYSTTVFSAYFNIIMLTVKCWSFVRRLMPAPRNPSLSKRNQTSVSFHSIQRWSITIHNTCFYLFIGDGCQNH